MRNLDARCREVTCQRDKLLAQNAKLEEEKKCHLARIAELGRAEEETNQLRSQISNLRAFFRWAQSCLNPVDQIPVGTPVAPPSTRCPTASAAHAPQAHPAALEVLAQICEQQ